MIVKRKCVSGVLGAMLILGAGWILAGNLDPTGPPGPTMHTLDEIYTVLTNINGLITQPSSGVPKTGQTNSYAAGDDGAYQKGFAWLNPRFASGTGTSSECVVDNLTGLMWIKSPTSSIFLWPNALTYCENLDGSSGRGGYTDWRLPNLNELRSVIDVSRYGPALPDGHPFIGVQNGNYWTSTTTANATDNAWLVDLNVGQVTYAYKTYTATIRVWPVRGP